MIDNTFKEFLNHFARFNGGILSCLFIYMLKEREREREIKWVRDKPESGFNVTDAVAGIALSTRQSLLHSLPVSLSLVAVALKSEKSSMQRQWHSGTSKM